MGATSAEPVAHSPGLEALQSLLIPGERFNRTIVEYLKFARSFNERFPGFETDIHGLIEERDGSRIRYFMDCARYRAA